MLRPPPIQSAPRYPATSAIAAAAIVVSVMRWSFNQDISASFMDYHVWNNWQLWRALTATFPHGGAMHLLFNLYWLWTFGTFIERVYGHFRFLAIYALLALGSMLAAFAVSGGNVIGLSGVIYGLWGMLMILQRYQFRFQDTVDRQTNQVFIGWFFLCIILTYTNLMSVANMAHGAGAVLGMLLGLAISTEGTTRGKSVAGIVGLMAVILLAATVFWPQVNPTRLGANETEYVGTLASDDGNYPKAIRLLEIAAHKRNAPAHAWFNLAVAYHKAGRATEANAAFARAADMPDADDQMREVGRLMQSQSNIVNTNR